MSGSNELRNENRATDSYQDAIDVLESHSEQARNQGDGPAAREYSRAARTLKAEQEGSA